ncbi:hypothetical protein ElyMa_004001400 [Elysia marginata]|uniref:Uncharacterized protein n=1 Tax=Elysia marginata TaxID=1093978 RepID=A0AAV4G2E4_9GAST|nr:hypothetical protein ElyMa_004001400 [Elysia marginata]
MARKKTMSLNMEKDDSKLWRLIGALSRSEGKATQIVLEKDGNTVTGKATADLLIKQYAAVSNIKFDPEKKIQIRKNTKNLKETPTDQERDLNKKFTQHELDSAIQYFKLKKSQGDDGVTKEMIQHLGKNMKKSCFNSKIQAGQQEISLKPGRKP